MKTTKLLLKFFILIFFSTLTFALNVLNVYFINNSPSPIKLINEAAQWRIPRNWEGQFIIIPGQTMGFIDLRDDATFINGVLSSKVDFIPINRQDDHLMITNSYLGPMTLWLKKRGKYCLLKEDPSTEAKNVVIRFNADYSIMVTNIVNGKEKGC
jgi:hypothetical protein